MASGHNCSIICGHRILQHVLARSAMEGRLRMLATSKRTLFFMINGIRSRAWEILMPKKMKNVRQSVEEAERLVVTGGA